MRAAQDERWIRKIGTNLRISHFTSGWCESRMHEFMDEHGQETSGKVFKDEQGAPIDVYKRQEVERAARTSSQAGRNRLDIVCSP